jgi:hypothetical protein
MGLEPTTAWTKIGPIGRKCGSTAAASTRVGAIEVPAFSLGAHRR